MDFAAYWYKRTEGSKFIVLATTALESLFALLSVHLKMGLIRQCCKFQTYENRVLQFQKVSFPERFRNGMHLVI